MGVVEASKRCLNIIDTVEEFLRFNWASPISYSTAIECAPSHLLTITVTVEKITHRN